MKSPVLHTQIVRSVEEENDVFTFEVSAGKWELTIRPFLNGVPLETVVFFADGDGALLMDIVSNVHTTVTKEIVSGKRLRDHFVVLHER